MCDPLHRIVYVFKRIYVLVLLSAGFSEGYRHPSSTTVARTVRILHTLLGLVGKHRNCDKFEVNTQSVAYLAGKRKENQTLPLYPRYVCPVFNVCTCACYSSAHGVRGGAQPLQS